jgi:hypothetical protein
LGSTTLSRGYSLSKKSARNLSVIWFTEAIDSKSLEDAKTLLDELDE